MEKELGDALEKAHAAKREYEAVKAALGPKKDAYNAALVELGNLLTKAAQPAA